LTFFAYVGVTPYVFLRLFFKILKSLIIYSRSSIYEDIDWFAVRHRMDRVVIYVYGNKSQLGYLQVTVVGDGLPSLI